MQWCFIIAFVPETYAPVLLRRKARRLRKETGNESWQAPIEKLDRSVIKTVAWSCIRPFQLLFLEQMCLNLCLISALLLGIIYLFFGVSQCIEQLQEITLTLCLQAFALVFMNNHGFNEWQTGLTFVGLFCGQILGVCCDFLWQKNCKIRSRLQTSIAKGFVDSRLVRNNNGVSEPEFRLPPTIA